MMESILGKKVYLSFTALRSHRLEQDLPKGGTTRSELDHSTSIINQDSLQTYPQANPMEAFSQNSFFPDEGKNLTSVKLS